MLQVKAKAKKLLPQQQQQQQQSLVKKEAGFVAPQDGAS